MAISPMPVRVIRCMWTDGRLPWWTVVRCGQFRSPADSARHPPVSASVCQDGFRRGHPPKCAAVQFCPPDYVRHADFFRFSNIFCLRQLSAADNYSLPRTTVSDICQPDKCPPVKCPRRTVFRRISFRLISIWYRLPNATWLCVENNETISTGYFIKRSNVWQWKLVKVTLHNVKAATFLLNVAFLMFLQRFTLTECCWVNNVF